jgi:hypothetical protein
MRFFNICVWFVLVLILHIDENAIYYLLLEKFLGLYRNCFLRNTVYLVAKKCRICLFLRNFSNVYLKLSLCFKLYVLIGKLFPIEAFAF